MTLCGSQMSRRANLALVGLTALLLSNVGHAAAPTPIMTCGFAITIPGQYYLANDLLGCPGPGITIWASDVRLRLDGYTMQGSGHGGGIVAVGQTDILIQGPGTITGFANGLSFVNVDFSNVIEVTATRNEVGFFVTGLLTSFSNNNVFQSNVITENSSDGIDIFGGSENKVINNLVTTDGLSGLGIGLFAADLNEVHANIVTGTPNTTGIFVQFFSTQNNIEGNTALGNGFDMADQSPNCDDNRWQGNQFDTANQPCIQ